MKLKDPSLLKNLLFIDGKWTKAKQDQTFTVYNPYNQEPIIEISDAGALDAQLAIDAASTAFTHWRSVSPSDRVTLLRKLQSLILEHAEDLATLLTTEQGKLFAEALSEVNGVAATVDWYADETLRIHGQTIIPTNNKIRRWTIYQPMGVVFAITPWNFPLALPLQQLAPALAAGCTIIIKPAEDTPLSALAAAELIDRAGFPPGTVNILTCHHPEPVSDVMMNDERVRKLCFTGSTSVGKKLMTAAGATTKRLCLEMGGNAPLLVFGDADLETVVADSIKYKFYNAGQICTNINRFYLENQIHDHFVELFSTKAKLLKHGNGLDKNTTLAPVINEAAIIKIESLIKDAISKGARLITGGKRVNKQQLFFEPTVLIDVNPTMRIHHEEIFGPVAAMYRFNNEAEALSLANNTSYGLAAFAYTTNMNRAFRLTELLEAGSVAINTFDNYNELTPFGGHKQSGIGHEGGVTGSIKHFCELKSVHVGVDFSK